MRQISLAQAGVLYSVASEAEVRRHRVSHAPLNTLAVNVGRLAAALRVGRAYDMHGTPLHVVQYGPRLALPSDQPEERP